MAKIHMPQIAEFGTQLTTMVGKVTTATESADHNVFDESCHTSRYWTRDDQLVALCQVDLEVAAAMGASLAMIPAGAAEEAAKEGDLGDNLMDAYCEVAKIMAALLCADGSLHVRWTTMAKTLDALTDADKAILENSVSRIDVEGYGGGKMTLVAIDSE
jgi:hypothetical protein